jgi:hypothetical protein
LKESARAEAEAEAQRLHLPLHATHWDDSVSLKREDIYGDDRP